MFRCSSLKREMQTNHNKSEMQILKTLADFTNYFHWNFLRVQELCQEFLSKTFFPSKSKMVDVNSHTLIFLRSKTNCIQQRLFFTFCSYTINNYVNLVHLWCRGGGVNHHLFFCSLPNKILHSLKFIVSEILLIYIFLLFSVLFFINFMKKHIFCIGQLHQ